MSRKNKTRQSGRRNAFMIPGARAYGQEKVGTGFAQAPQAKAPKPRSRRAWTKFEWAAPKTAGGGFDLDSLPPEAADVVLKEREYAQRGLSRVAINNLYVVDINVGEAVPAAGPFIYLSIRRLERSKLPRDWRDLQRIKNEIVGPEFEGFELFPAESRLVDSADQFHLWVLPSPIRRDEDGTMHNGIPVGYGQRFVSGEGDAQRITDAFGDHSGTQRPLEATLEDFHAPLLTPEQIAKGDLR